MGKVYVLDTNVLLSDSMALYSFAEHDLILPVIVLEELDRHKDRQDEVGRNARDTVRKLGSLTKDTKDFKKGISLGESRGILKIIGINDFGSVENLPAIPKEFDAKTGDNLILNVCLAFRQKYPEQEMVLVTRDLLLKLKAGLLGIPCEDYKKLQAAKSVSSLYTGVSEILGDYDLNKFYSEGMLEVEEEVLNQLYPNQFVVLKNNITDGSALAKYNQQKKALVKINDISGIMSKIKGKNSEQKFALDLLLDSALPMVTLSGKAGTGKTLLSVAAGLHQVLEEKKYKSLVICRPIQPLGKDIGYLPGSTAEKLEPWIAPIKDNLRFLLSGDGKKTKRGEDTLNLLFENGTIEVQAMTHIRGRSIANAYMIFDEIQNINAHELKTIITRVGEGTKIVLTGDVEQIDSNSVDSVTNGLTIAIEKFKHSDLVGHITLTKGERSAISTLAAEILG